MMREGKKKSDPRIIVIGILLMVYSYLTPNPWFDWGVGSALCFTAYRFWS